MPCDVLLAFRQSRLTVTLIPNQESRLGIRPIRAEFELLLWNVLSFEIVPKPGSLGACATFRCSLETQPQPCRAPEGLDRSLLTGSKVSKQ